MKNEILKYLGILVILIGVAVLVIYHFGAHAAENTLLIVGGLCIFVGAVGHVILNKYIQ
jgi:uncharacterized protein YjeT (DUF2065 family)